MLSFFCLCNYGVYVTDFSLLTLNQDNYSYPKLVSFKIYVSSNKNEKQSHWMFWVFTDKI